MKKWGLFLLLNCSLLASEVTLKELDELRDQKLISQDDYLLLREEISPKLKENFYLLKINGYEVDKFYSVFEKDGNRYLDIDTFFQSIDIKNYRTKDGIKVILGETLRKIEINLKNKEIYENGEKIEKNKELFIENEDKVYIEEEVFKKIFTIDYRIDKEKARISLALNFTTPDELLRRLDLRAESIDKAGNNGILHYESKRELFELGYARVTANKLYTKNTGEKSYKSSWDGSIDYQGGLLYGQLQANYNAKENELGTLKLEYNEIWERHTLQLENRRNGRSREWGLSFFKDKSYYTNGKKVIIRESVPVGSRVELKYMGASIAIKNAEDGQVIFDNPIITTDRTYTLIIYTPDGQVFEKVIKTAENFDQQSKGEVQYNVSFNENHSAKKVSTNIETFYGLSDKVTVGAGYTRGVEEIDKKYKYVQDGRANIIYSDTVNGYSYVLKLDMEKSFDDYVVDNKKYDDKYKYGGLTQLNIGKWKYTFERNQFGEFYTDKANEKVSVQYDVMNNVRLTYDYGKTFKYQGDEEKNSNYGVSVNKNIGNILFSLDAKKSESSDSEYSLNAYYTTKSNISTRLENKWTKSGKEYEALLSVYNNNYKGFLDYAFEFGYSEQYKDRATLRLTFKLDNWFEISSDLDKTGRQEHKMGINRIIDLKNPLKKVDSTDVSRVKVITFVDENNNNIHDANEKLVEGVEVTIGTTTNVTDLDGEAMFYGVSNGILYDLKPKIKKPSFTLGDNKVTIKGQFASTIEAFIPIKPMLNLTRTIKIDEALKLNEVEKEELYQDILVEIKDINGKSIELTVPDNTGSFDVSGLFPEKYVIEVSYLGVKYNLEKLNEIIKLSYLDNDFENKIVFNLNSKMISKEN